MISDHLIACQVYVSSSEVLIDVDTPDWTHAPFADCDQRIFMYGDAGRRAAIWSV